jgi:hypothetical protein
MHQKKDKIEKSITFYVYLLNFFLIGILIWLRCLDIYYTLMLIGDSQVSEVNPIAQWMLNFDPIIIYTVSILPFLFLFIFNYLIRKKPYYYMLGFMFVLIGFMVYLIPVVQNSLDIMSKL